MAKKGAKESNIRKIARIVDASLRNGQVARRSVSDPKFRRAVQTDRRGALSEFETVRHALEDRAKGERRTATKKKKGR